jgi:hypothetical protein
LLPSLQRAITSNLPVTLAGARREDGDHDAAMTSVGSRSPTPVAKSRSSLSFRRSRSRRFIRKIGARQVGYFGSANLTANGLAESTWKSEYPCRRPMSSGWWLIEVLRECGALARE